jgi:hypothetical protein
MKKARTSFLKKRSKKLLYPSGFHDAGQIPYLARGQDVKVFWFFSSEKNTLQC